MSEPLSDVVLAHYAKTYRGTPTESMATELLAARARILELERERDLWTRNRDEICGQYQEQIAELRDTISRMRATLAQYGIGLVLP